MQVWTGEEWIHTFYYRKVARFILIVWDVSHQLLILMLLVRFSFRNIAKMEDAKVEIDDGKDESVSPDTVYQYVPRPGIVYSYGEIHWTDIHYSHPLL